MATPLIDKMPSSKKAVRIVQDQNVEILSRLDAIEARIEQARPRESTTMSTFAQNGSNQQTRAKTID